MCLWRCLADLGLPEVLLSLSCRKGYVLQSVDLQLKKVALPKYQ
jgi:hypothetical protein